jgi:S-adenosylmethionine/arginine decarboxylase-like enzyme
MCGDTNPHLVIDVLREAFQARNVVVKEHKRGEELDQSNWQAASKRKVAVRQVAIKTRLRKAA